MGFEHSIVSSANEVSWGVKKREKFVFELLGWGSSPADMPLLKVVVSSTRNSTETVAALERDLDGQSPSFSTHEDDQELVDSSQPADEPSQV